MAAICVFCSSNQDIDQRYVEFATAIGVHIARRGHSLVSGGGSYSMMGSVASAVRAAGGHTFGVIPEALRDLEVADLESDELVITADMRSRKARMDSEAEAFLILPGGLGTLEELFEVWVARSLGMHTKPVVICDPDGVFAGLSETLDQLGRSGFIRDEALAVVHWVRTPEEALDQIEDDLQEWPFHDEADIERMTEEALEGDA